MFWHRSMVLSVSSLFIPESAAPTVSLPLLLYVHRHLTNKTEDSKLATWLLASLSLFYQYYFFSTTENISPQPFGFPNTCEKRVQ